LTRPHPCSPCRQYRSCKSIRLAKITGEGDRTRFESGESVMKPGIERGYFAQPRIPKFCPHKKRMCRMRRSLEHILPLGPRIWFHGLHCLSKCHHLRDPPCCPRTSLPYNPFYPRQQPRRKDMKVRCVEERNCICHHGILVKWVWRPFRMRLPSIFPGMQRSEDIQNPSFRK
jgi:hypothetical protein